jgi:hypothetical protein
MKKNLLKNISTKDSQLLAQVFWLTANVKYIYLAGYLLCPLSLKKGSISYFLCYFTDLRRKSAISVFFLQSALRSNCSVMSLVVSRIF